MKITSIELAGATRKGQAIPDAFATIRRHTTDSQIIVELITPNDSRTHCVGAHGVNDRDEQFSIAQMLQRALDGYEGSNSEVHEYFREVQRFAD